MAAKGETNFRKRVRRDLKLLEPKIHFFPIQQVAIGGTPDFLISAGGIFVALELKDEDGATSKLQDYELTRVGESGGYSFVARPSDWDSLYLIIQGIAIANYRGRWVYAPEDGKPTPKNNSRRNKND